jgi:NAD(P)H-hydrate epimerase
MGCAVQAHHTVTFGLPKTGNLLMPVFHTVEDSSYPTYPSAGSVRLDSLRPQLMTLQLPPRAPNGHKGVFGDALFIAAPKDTWARLILPPFFLKSGGGYSVWQPPHHNPFIASKGSEIVFLPQEETSSGSISPANRTRLLELSRRLTSWSSARTFSRPGDFWAHPGAVPENKQTLLLAETV